MVVLRWAVLSIVRILDRRPRLCSDFLTVDSIKSMVGRVTGLLLLVVGFHEALGMDLLFGDSRIVLLISREREPCIPGLYEPFYLQYLIPSG